MFKRHSAVQREFSRLVRDDPRVDTGLRTFLSRTYQLKAIADYETGPGSDVSPELAAEAVATGKRFVAKMAELIEGAAGGAPP